MAEEEHQQAAAEDPEVGEDNAQDEIDSGTLSLELVQPADRFNVVYICLVVVGSGYLMPYNSFVTCVDYWHGEFPDYPVEFLISFVYIIVSFFSVLLTNLLVKVISTHTRIVIGYVLSLGPLIYVSVVHLWWNAFSNKAVSLASLVIACAVSGIGCSIQQSSFYGYSGMLPPRYVQAVMVGESLSGVLVSLNRIVTKFYGPDLEMNTLIFFVLSCLLLIFCSFLHQYVKRTSFSRFYTGDVSCRYHSSRKGRIDSNDTVNSRHEAELNSNDSSDSKTESQVVRRVIEGTVPSASMGFGALSNDVEQLIEEEVKSRGNFCPNFKKGFQKRMDIIRYKELWVHMCAISSAYLCTLLLFPGFETEVKATGDDLEYLQHEGVDVSWIPVSMVTCFNCFDLLGKILSGCIDPRRANPRLILHGSLVRFLIVPLFLLCVYPQEDPFFNNVKLPLALTVILGFTNGYYGSAPMIMAPQTVSTASDREIVGNIMTFSYFVGLVLGASGAFILKYFIPKI